MESNEPTILVVDDDPDDVELATLAIEKARQDAHVISASDGKSALMLLLSRTSLPDLVLLDLKMPGMSGVETLREMRAIDKLKKIPVVVITSSSLESDMCEALSAGADGFAHKAFDMAQFNRDIEALLHLWLRN